MEYNGTSSWLSAGYMSSREWTSGDLIKLWEGLGEEWFIKSWAFSGA